MNRFLEGYLECAAWLCEGDDAREAQFSADFLAQAAGDCAAFQAQNAELLALAGDDAQNGHDFWLTRNHHGAGFWDRGYPDAIGNALTEAAHKAGERDLYVGDDGMVYS